MSDAEIGVKMIVLDTDQAHITTIKIDEDSYRIIYRDPESGKDVLDITSKITGNTKINMVDIGFWNFTIDGQPASLADLGDYSQFNGVEPLPTERNLNFKRS